MLVTELISDVSDKINILVNFPFVRDFSVFERFNQSPKSQIDHLHPKVVTNTVGPRPFVRITTVKLKIPGKLFLTSVTFKL